MAQYKMYFTIPFVFRTWYPRRIGKWQGKRCIKMQQIFHSHGRSYNVEYLYGDSSDMIRFYDV